MELSSNNQAIMDVSFVQIGLSMASIFFLIAGYMIVYENPLQDSSEIDMVAMEIKSMIDQIDSQWYEQELRFMFPESFLNLHAELSHDFIRILSLDSDRFSRGIPLPQTLWICNNESKYLSSYDVHQEIKHRFGHLGTVDDPCILDKEVLHWFEEEWELYQKKYHRDPFIWKKGGLVSFEKCIIYKQVCIKENEQSIPLLECIIVKHC